MIASTGFLVGIAFDAFAAAPEDINLRAQFGAEIHRPHRLLNRVSADFGVVAGERAVLEDRIGEEIGRRHRDDQAVVLQRLFEVAS